MRTLNIEKNKNKNGRTLQYNYMDGLKKDVKTLNAIEHPLLRKWIYFSIKEKKMREIEDKGEKRKKWACYNIA